MTVLAKFDGYTLRSADTIADLEMLDTWIQKDDAHREVFDPGDFVCGVFATDSRPGCYALEDGNGTVFFIRLSRAARVKIQFPPDTNSEQRNRNLRALLHGMAFLEVELSHSGCEEWIFDTDNQQLKKVAERILGFRESTVQMVKPIAEPEKKRESVEVN
jgi:hypothetical protein